MFKDHKEYYRNQLPKEWQITLETNLAQIYTQKFLAMTWEHCIESVLNSSNESQYLNTLLLVYKF
ncbi:hypothetical protein [Escherichia phage vB_EcoM_JNE01]|nr:hypothetical protein [Escherichia phage vB_EcoM_JNE01]